MNNTEKYIATIGMFDGVHRGHRALLAHLNDYAHSRGLTPMVVTFTPHPMAVVCPGREPKLLTSFDERRQLLAQALPSGKIVELNFNSQLRTKTARQFMQLLHNDYGVDALIMGYNHHFGSDGVRNFAQYQQFGAEVGLDVILGEQMTDSHIHTQVSSSSIRNALNNGDIATANKLLGRRYALQGEVVDGRHIGRTIGFPTANLRTDQHRLVPAPGVYAASAIVDGASIPAMINIGVCPTVTCNAAQTIEVNIIDWSGDIYNKTLRVEFAERLRSEQKFDSLQALQAQLEADRRETLRINS